MAAGTEDDEEVCGTGAAFGDIAGGFGGGVNVEEAELKVELAGKG